MNSIRCIYHGTAPEFPATDQHPDASRWFVAGATVQSETDWQKRIDAAQAGAKVALFGTADEAAIEKAMEAAGEARGSLKHKLAAATASRMPSLDLVVDALGEMPSLEEIAAVLNPPAPPEPTPAQKLAAAGLSVADLKSLLGLPA